MHDAKENYKGKLHSLDERLAGGRIRVCTSGAAMGSRRNGMNWRAENRDATLCIN
jgi:hypothetical protein